MQQPTQKRGPIATILVVEDDSALRKSLKFSLQIEGFAVRLYADARELLDDPDLPTFGCMIVDQRLEGMTGLDLVAALRARRIALPAILVTTNPPAILKQLAAEAGVPLIEKPFLGEALFESIRNALAHRPERAGR
jgi:two-component system, LuxR family, response regulator FixJ